MKQPTQSIQANALSLQERSAPQSIDLQDYLEASIQLTTCDPGPDDTPWHDPPPAKRLV